jgi:hypothetical protein
MEPYPYLIGDAHAGWTGFGWYHHKTLGGGKCTSLSSTRCA